MPALVLFETYHKSIQYRGMEMAELRYATLKSIRATHVSELTEPVLLRGGEFKARHQISLADAIIAAYAFVHRAPPFLAFSSMAPAFHFRRWEFA